ncbi:DUF1007 family protein [Salipiger mucosus]|uniref:Polyphosphate kinase n=1 Tax=Salipiger mucosus DSM 16094 TaxID=1123237 RepID=S9QFP5_9RHOB|nr:DUF1007 family protein [Salipiger mucosus]EPX78702.1 hypothetical protein Salmuc_04284 [Salipiger mucosus DSM 16094]
MIRIALFIATLQIAGPALAHPHVFVDTTLRFDVDDAQEVVAVEVTWRYDDFFTLLILEDMGLDADGDGVLTDDELETLRGFDLDNWYEGFEGDLYVYAGDRKLELGPPTSVGLSVDEGRITATHRRAVEAAPADGLRVLQYDPTYYTAYEVSGGVHLPEPCRAEIEAPDPDAAAEQVERALETVPEDQFEVLEVGIHYAERIRISCDRSS